MVLSLISLNINMKPYLKAEYDKKTGKTKMFLICPVKLPANNISQIKKINEALKCPKTISKVLGYL